MRRLFGHTAIAAGIFMGLGVLLNLGGPHGFGILAVAFLLCSLLPIGAGTALLKRHASPALQAQARRAWDSELMRLAARRDGSLTVAEVVTHADLDATRAEEYLDDLCRRGLAEVRVTDEGRIVYRFELGAEAEEKRAAKGVLDD